MKVTFRTTDFERACGHPEEITVKDLLQLEINALEQKELQKDFKGARDILENIKSILDEPDTLAFKPEETRCRTLLAVHRMLRANPIRLRYEAMNITGYFNLLRNVKVRLFNKRADVNTQRKVVAEEMSKLNLYPQILTERWQVRETKAPNRAFMDVLYKTNPQLAEVDIQRRETAKAHIKWLKEEGKR